MTGQDIKGYIWDQSLGLDLLSTTVCGSCSASIAHHGVSIMTPQNTTHLKCFLKFSVQVYLPDAAFGRYTVHL